ncbi:MAG: YraN family protein [Elusimicrobia bacterium]|nr:YraN family protein [Elusimicrobiota bacterium]
MSFLRLAIGRDGESRAERYLKSLGYRLIERSPSNRLGQIDLVMKDGDTVVFVEVKTRTNRELGWAEEGVHARKQRKIAQAALVYIQERKLARTPFRFDVVAVQDGEIRHVPDAFRPSYYW